MKPTRKAKHRTISSKRARPTTEDRVDSRSRRPVGIAASFPIVGIGASAGGLEAFTELLKHLPTETGMAFVLVQHLDPTHDSILTDLLSRTTKIPVRQARNNTSLEPNHIYVIPPRAIMSLSKGLLKVTKRREEAGARHVIDHFLESLAKDRGPQAIGVILSGTASDGTLGLETIKNEGGITIAQDNSAKYDSMPRSAIASGCVDLILGPSQIAAELARMARHPGLLPHSVEPDFEPRKGQNDFQKVLQLLRLGTGTDFTLYKPATLQRRISRRIVLNKLSDLGGYVDFLHGHKEEVAALYQDVLINVTSFFRNPKVFDFLKNKLFPKFIENRTPDQPVRIWVPGCSTGQEAYSMAMVFLEFAAKVSTQISLQIFATDINEKPLEKARSGLFSKIQVQDMAAERRRRFFVEEEGGFRICKAIRELCIFARHDILSDPPFSKVDLVSCRNLLIYLEAPVQKRLMPIFHYALKPGGFLLLGSSETIGGFTELFSMEDKTHKLYSRKDATSRLPMKFQRDSGPVSTEREPAEVRHVDLGIPAELNAQREAERVLLANYGPAAVLVSDTLEALHFHGPINRYLELSTGRANHKILKMVREGLILPVKTALHRAKSEGAPARVENVSFALRGQTLRLNIEVTPLKNQKSHWSLVVFEPVNGRGNNKAKEHRPESKTLPPDLKAAHAEIARLRNDLVAAREYQQSVIEQNEAANEELQTANEESQSSNEELQSINEELETTKEELQSANEELTTVNEEMGHRNVELHRINSDLNNVLGGVQMCIVVLDGDLCIRRFTPLAQKILNLVATDLGRPITNIRPNFEFPDLEGTLTAVVNTVQPKEAEVQDKEGHWYSLRLMPYKTLDNRIDGAVLVLVDIDALKRSEQRIKAALDYAESIIETVAEPLVVLSDKLQFERANRAFYETFRVSATEIKDRTFNQIRSGKWNNPELTTLLREVLPKGKSFNDFEAELEVDNSGPRTMLFNARPLNGQDAQAERILLAIQDVTERKQLEVIRESEQRLRRLAEALPQLVWTCFPDGNCDYFNSKWSEYTGVPVEGLLGGAWRDTLHVEDRNRTRDYWWAALSGQVPYDLEYRIRRVDGIYHWFKVRATPMRDNTGAITKWFGTCTDIEDQKRIELELQKAREELEQRVKERTQKLGEMVQELESFSYSVSHDLRSPLRAMLGFADLAMKRGGKRLPNPVKDYLQRIMASASRADRLVQDVLHYSRVSRANVPLEPINLEKLLREILQQSAELQPPRAEIQIQSPLLDVIGNETSLGQCVTNLLDNAIKFVLPGIVPRIKIFTEPLDGEVRLWFEDNGIGIEPSNVNRIFNIFERVHSAQEYEGTGIGLAILRKSVERMGGTVGVESEPGNGSRFWIQLKSADVKVKDTSQPS